MSATPSSVRVREFAEMIIEVSGSESGIVLGPLPEDDPKQRRPDITRAREVLRWEPRVSAHDGLKKTLSWFAECVREVY